MTLNQMNKKFMMKLEGVGSPLKWEEVTYPGFELRAAR